MRSARVLLASLILVILLHDGAESRRSGGSSSSSRGSSGARSSSSSRGSSSSSSSSRGSYSSSSRSHGSSSSSRSSGSSWGGSSSSSPGSKYAAYYGSAGRSWRDRYYGNRVVVVSTQTYYGGGSPYYYGRSGHLGTGRAGYTAAAAAPLVKSTQPTVTTDIVRATLFPGDPKMASESIFNYGNGTKPSPPITKLTLDNVQKTATVVGALVRVDGKMLTEDEKKRRDSLLKAFMGRTEEVVFVSDPTQPVMIKNIAYFWGAANLPQGDNETDCADFQPVNDANNYTFCDISSMKRCEKSLKDVYFLGKKYEMAEEKDRWIKVKFKDGTKADTFVWLCGPGDTCSGWECSRTEEVRTEETDPPDQSFITMLWLGGFGLIIGAIVLCCCCASSSQTSRMKTAARAADGDGDQSVAEQVPLTTPQYYGSHAPSAPDYPRQPPPPPHQQQLLDYPRDAPPPAYPGGGQPFGAAYGWNPQPQPMQPQQPPQPPYYKE